MAPGFRNRDRSNRSGRGQIEHNVLEGLPINQYREMEVAIGTSISENKQVHNDAYWPELPMPRESHLLPEHSQQILRAARSGRIYKRPAPPEEDREIMDDEEETKEIQKGFTVKKWVKVPRSQEDPEREYLAKRRKGLPSQYASGQPLVEPTPMRETKVKKLDAEGNISVYKVLVPQGQTIAGEVQGADAAVIEAVPATAAPGTVVEGVGVVNAEGVVVASEIVQQTPPRRRPPIPKKKSRRGPGRGRKKVVFVEGSTEQPAPLPPTDPVLSRLKEEVDSAGPSDGGDTPMADAGDEEDGSDEDGSDDDDHEEVKPSPAPVQETPSAGPPVAPTSAPAVEPPIEAVTEAAQEPVKEPSLTQAAPVVVPPPAESTTPKDAPPPPPSPPAPVVDAPIPDVPVEQEVKPEKKDSGRDPSSSPDLPLAHSRQNSINQLPKLPLDTSALDLDSAAAISTDATSTDALIADPLPKEEVEVDSVPKVAIPPEAPATEPAPSVAPPVESIHASDAEDDILGSLERHLDKDESMGGT
ncbi:hypothetical protein K504DRAFT_467502 [Pleomassaria siparia CBS 279.74]|uniref:Uncharacterized protein n=1 Tax=Pleomassaria siparia CBS 279.74 TaxID=1314801 RepID=A0A6G1KAZ9_9PLEO|nr:hypothetical protein K504DRAFT_467502 [Pleomassaria siparia CBS 279.74]